MDLTKIYTGEYMGLSKEENRIFLSNDNIFKLNAIGSNNMKNIAADVEQYGGKHIKFVNGCQNAILIGAVNSHEDYYYLYYDIDKDIIGGNTGCDGIKCLNNDNCILEPIKIDNKISEYLEKTYYYEVPFTDIFSSNKWNFNYNK